MFFLATKGNIGQGWECFTIKRICFKFSGNCINSHKARALFIKMSLSRWIGFIFVTKRN